MNERLNNIIDKLSRLYDVSISWDYAFFDGVYRLLVRHNSYYKDHTRAFGKYVYIEPKYVRQLHENTVAEIIEDNGIWPVIKRYKHSMYEHIKPITVEL